MASLHLTSDSPRRARMGELEREKHLNERITSHGSTNFVETLESPSVALLANSLTPGARLSYLILHPHLQITRKLHRPQQLFRLRNIFAFLHRIDLLQHPFRQLPRSRRNTLQKLFILQLRLDLFPSIISIDSSFAILNVQLRFAELLLVVDVESVRDDTIGMVLLDGPDEFLQRRSVQTVLCSKVNVSER